MAVSSGPGYCFQPQSPCVWFFITMKQAYISIESVTERESQDDNTRKAKRTLHNTTNNSK